MQARYCIPAEPRKEQVEGKVQKLISVILQPRCWLQANTMAAHLTKAGKQIGALEFFCMKTLRRYLY